MQPADLQVALREINVEQTDAQNADVQVVFTAYNPNSATILLETIHYTVLVDDFQMTSDDIGLSPEGFLAGQANTFTVVGNSTVTLRSTQEAVRNNLTASSWDSMVDGTAQYEVEGLYAYRLTGSNFQTNFFEREFSLTFP